MTAKKSDITLAPKTRFSPKPAMRRTKKPVAKKPLMKAQAKVKKAAVGLVSPLARPTKRAYIFAVGRRKLAVARVRWHQQPGTGVIVINGRALEHYFPGFELQQTVRDPFVITHQEGQGHVSVKVAGGGIQGQAEAVRLGIARALVKADPDVRLPLKRAGFLRRDPRVKERKKYGLKRARRAPQWQKR